MVCLRDIPDRRFYLDLQKRLFADHVTSCRNRGAQLAEFPSDQDQAMENYFPMMKTLLLEKIVPQSSCSYFTATNVQCQVAIGAELRNGKYKWLMNGSEIKTTWNLDITVKPTFLRYRFTDLIFQIMPDAAFSKMNFSLKDQPLSYILAMCECRL